jgi:alcohol dehydrogenase class IV
LCAALLPSVIRVNMRKAPPETKNRYGQIAQYLGVDDVAGWVESLMKEFGVGGLRTHGATEPLFPEAIQKAKQASSMRANPIELTDAELSEILHSSL